MTRTPPRRSTLRILFALGLAAGVVALVASPRPAAADAREDAKINYEQGKKMYAAGDYRGAIAAFARAEQLAPSPYNDFNIALAYDKLGEADIAVKYYRSYLGKAPDAPNKAAVEASIARLDSAAKAAEAKAEEARRAAEARRAEEERAEARRTDDAKRAEDQRLADELARKAEEQRAAGGGAAVGTGVTVGAGAAVGTGPAVGTGVPVAPTGDAELDRVQGIDVNAVRTERGGFDGGAMPAGAGPPTAGAGPDGAPPVANTGAGQDPNAAGGPTDQPKKKRAIYKQWWFWVVVGVSAYVLYSIAAADSPSGQARGRLSRDAKGDRDGADDVERRWTVLPEIGGGGTVQAGGGGATIMRW